MRKAKINRMDPAVAFLSNKVTGSAHTETPDGCNYDTGMAPYEAMPSGPQLGSDVAEELSYGARGGRGKKTSVV